MAAGDFSASNMRSALERSDKMWKDDMLKVEYEADVDVVLAIQKEQNATLKPITDDRKDVDIDVFWVDACGMTPQDCTPLCENDFALLESKKKSYALDLCQEIGFSVMEESGRTNLVDMEEQVAKGILMASKELDEWWAQMVVAKLETFVGINTVTNGRGTVVGTDTFISDADWTPSIFAYFSRVAKMNKFKNPYLLSGANLYELAWETAYDRANGEGKGADAKLKSMRKYFDLFNIDTVNDPDMVTYLMNRGAVAMGFKNKHPSTPKEFNGAGLTKSRTASRNIPGVAYDTTYSNTCIGDDIKHTWKFKIRGGVFNNPTGCTDGRNGVLRMVAGEPV